MTRTSLKLIAVAGVLAAGLTQGLAPAAWAEKGGCAQPISTGPDPVATDCLFILRAAVGSATCSNPCICQPRGVATKATDALLCLQFSVGQPVAIDCPCNAPGQSDLESSDLTFDPATDIVADTGVTGHDYNTSSTTNADPWGIDDNAIKSRFVKTRYIGAFSQDADPEIGDWTADWTVELHGNHTAWHPATAGTLNGATPVADGTCPANTTVAGSTDLPSPFPGMMDICQLPARFAVSGGTISLTNDNIYILGGLGSGGTVIGDGDAAGKTETGLTAAAHSTLQIEAGTLVLGDIQEALIVTRGSQIFASGTAANPISMNSVTQFNNWRDGVDYTGLGIGAGARREWGGLVVTGFAWANTCNTPGTCDALVEGVAVPVHYGGTNAGWNGGSIQYVEISNSGYDVDGNGNDLNCMTLYTLGAATIVSHIDCNHAGDDSFEFFGGNVVADHVIATGGLDDNLDTDVGFRGGVQFALLRQFQDDGDKGFEADNGPNGNNGSPLLEPRSRPHYANVTWLGQHTLGSQHGVSIGFRSGTGISVWNTTMQNSKKTELQSEKATSATDGTCEYAGPGGLGVQILHNLWVYQPTPGELPTYYNGVDAGDVSCVQTFFESDPGNNATDDPGLDPTSGFPNQAP